MPVQPHSILGSNPGSVLGSNWASQRGKAKGHSSNRNEDLKLVGVWIGATGVGVIDKGMRPPFAVRSSKFSKRLVPAPLGDKCEVIR